MVQKNEGYEKPILSQSADHTFNAPKGKLQQKLYLTPCTQVKISETILTNFRTVIMLQKDN